jgi:hypothetical protein
VQVEEADHHQADMEATKGEDPKMESQRVLHGIGKERQTVTYQTVKEYIIQLVQKTHKNGKDVADSLRKMEKIDMTKNMRIRKLSQETGTDKIMEQEGFNMHFKAEIDIYTKRKHEFEDNMNKTYSLIYPQHCNKTIQDRCTMPKRQAVVIFPEVNYEL